MAKNLFSRAEEGSQGVSLWVLGVVWISKSGLGILTRAPEVPFFVPPKRQKWAVFAVWGYKKWHFGCLNQNSETTFRDPNHPQNPQLDTLVTFFGPRKVIFGHFVNFAYFYLVFSCLLYTSPSPRDATLSRMPSSA